MLALIPKVFDFSDKLPEISRVAVIKFEISLLFCRQALGFQPLTLHYIHSILQLTLDYEVSDMGNDASLHSHLFITPSQCNLLWAQDLFNGGVTEGRVRAL